MKLLYLFLLILAANTSTAQSIKEPLSVNYASLEAYSKNFCDILSASSNQASLAQLKTGGFDVYGEKRFLLEELNNYAAVVAIPTSSGAFGLEGNYFGSQALNENELGILYGRKVTNHIDIGAKFNYYTLRIPGYGSMSVINFEAGMLFHLTEKLHTGIHVYNPQGSKLGKNAGQKLASIYRCGIGYDVSEMFFIGTEVVKKENEEINVNAGFQYNFQKNIFIRAGVSNLTNNSYAAIGFQLNFARIDVNTSYHPQLGFTPGLFLSFNFKDHEKN